MITVIPVLYTSRYFGAMIQLREYLQSILNSTREPITILDDLGNIIVFNESSKLVSRKFLGVELESSKNLVDLLPEWRKPTIMKAIEAARNGNAYEYEVQYPCGSWLEASFYPVKSIEGPHNRICCTVKDITNKKKEAEAIKISERRYHTVFETMSEGVIFQTDKTGNNTANSGASRILGVSQKELRKHGLMTPALNWTNQKGEQVFIKELFCPEKNRKQSVRNLIVGFTRGNELRWLSMSAEPVLMEPGNHACVFTFTDITESINYRDEIQLLSKIMKETSNIVVVTDKNERITWANDSFTRISEFELPEAMNKKPGHLLAGPEKSKSEVEKIKNAIRVGNPVQGEILNYSKTGKKYWTNYNIQPVKDANGTVQKYFSIQQDITELKRIREDIVQHKLNMQQQLAAAALNAQEEKQTQIGQELHDNVNQILAASQMYTSMIISGAEAPREKAAVVKDYIGLAIEEIRKLSHQLVNPQLSGADFSELFSDLLDTVNPKAKVDAQIDSELQDILNEDQKLAIYRIAQEQLNNINKYAEATKVLFSLRKKDNLLQLVIEDNGIGFDPCGKKPGIGIKNIKARAAALEGAAQFISAPANGCKLEVIIPLHERRVLEAC